MRWIATHDKLPSEECPDKESMSATRRSSVSKTYVGATLSFCCVAIARLYSKYLGVYYGFWPLSLRVATSIERLLGLYGLVNRHHSPPNVTRSPGVGVIYEVLKKAQTSSSGFDGLSGATMEGKSEAT